MSDKKIDGAVVVALMDASRHLGMLDLEMHELQWRICYRDDLTPRFSEVKSHCRKLLKAIESAEDHLLALREDKPEQPVIRQVK